jgi:16S rRNA (cytidine1402-2'-O)-methyltransferase
MLFLIPAPLSDHDLQTIPSCVKDAVRSCALFFVEDERTARRYLKKLWPEMVIDQYEWHRIDAKEPAQKAILLEALKQGKHAGVLSEAGCPGIADPGAQLVAWAQEAGCPVKPLVGPSSILLALMASGMNGQSFCFHGYLPVKEPERSTKIRDMESESGRRGMTQIFIETPYRNQAIIEALLKACRPGTRLCIAVDITGSRESIRTLPISAWKQAKPSLGKVPAIYLLMA